MNRNVFGPWGLDLGSGPFACALATTGVLQGIGWGIHRSLKDAVALAARLRVQLKAQASLPWFSYIAPLDYAGDVPADLMVETWRRFLKEGPPDVRLEVHQDIKG